MLTRGKLFAEIIDSLAQFMFVLDTRGKMGMFDINKYCEDFAKELLNKTYHYRLENLNQNRSNEPGLDLGDEFNKIGVQVTTQKSSEKVNNTLGKITSDHKEKYDRFIVFILGKKQNTYTGINSDLANNVGFDFKRDIIDIHDVEKEILALPVEKIQIVYEFIKRDLIRVYSEFQLDTTPAGERVSILSGVETVPEIEFNNCNKLVTYNNLLGGVTVENPFQEEFALNLNEYCKEIFNILIKLPRITREAFYVIVERSEIDGTDLYVRDELIKRIINVPMKRYYEEVSLLEENGLISVLDYEPNKWVIKPGKVCNKEDILYFIVTACKYYKLSLKEILVDLNFSLLEES